MMISIRIIIILLILLILQPGIPAAIMTNFAPITLQFSFPSFFPWNNFHLPCPSLCCCSVPQECHTLCESDPWTAALQASLSFPISWTLLRFMSLSWWYITISSSATLFSFCLQSLPESGLFQWICSSHQVAKVLELQVQHQSFQ